MCQRVDELVDGLLFYLIIVQSDAQIGCQVQFTGQIAENALEESVDGLYSEIAIIVKQLVECFASFLADLRLGKSCSSHDVLQVVRRVGQLVPNAIKLAEDAHLHFFRCLVGEGDSENRAIAHRILDQQFDVFCGEGERLSTSRTGFIYG